MSYVIHQYWHELRHSVDAGRKGAILGRAVYGLVVGLGLVQPLSGYRVYDVEHSQLVCSRRFLEVCVDLLDENRFRLRRGERGERKRADVSGGPRMSVVSRHGGADAMRRCGSYLYVGNA